MHHSKSAPFKESSVSLTWSLWFKSRWPPLAEREVGDCNFAAWCIRVMLAVGTNQPPNFRPGLLASVALPSSRTCWPLPWVGRWQTRMNSPVWDVSGSVWKGPKASTYAPLARALSLGHVSLWGWELESSCVSGTEGQQAWWTVSHRTCCCPRDVRALRHTEIHETITVTATAQHKVLFLFPMGTLPTGSPGSGLVPSGSVWWHQHLIFSPFSNFLSITPNLALNSTVTCFYLLSASWILIYVP